MFTAVRVTMLPAALIGWLNTSVPPESPKSQVYSRSSYGFDVPVAVIALAETWIKHGVDPDVREHTMPPAVFMAVIVTFGLPPKLMLKNSLRRLAAQAVALVPS